jgi:RNA polymerase sigma-70 factor (ECF subfamily)
MAKSIQELAERFLVTSQEKDFKSLYDRIKPGLLNHCKSILIDEEVAQDAVSKTFEKIWVKVSQYDPSRGNFSTWAYNIARNESLLIKKNSKKFTPLVYESIELEGRDHDEFIPLSDITPEDIFAEPEWEINNQEGGFDDLYDTVLEKMKQLPDIYKDILMDREIHKMKYQDIADKYGMKKRAVATRIRRARIKIREMFPGIKLNFID